MDNGKVYKDSRWLQNLLLCNKNQAQQQRLMMLSSTMDPMSKVFTTKAETASKDLTKAVKREARRHAVRGMHLEFFQELLK